MVGEAFRSPGCAVDPISEVDNVDILLDNVLLEPSTQILSESVTHASLGLPGPLWSSESEVR